MSETNSNPNRPRTDFSKYIICQASDKDKDVEDPVKAGKQLNLRKINELPYNPTWSELKAAQEREQEELRAEGKIMKKNTLTGFVEWTHLSAAQFEEQRRAYNRTKSALNKRPTDSDPVKMGSQTTSETIEDSSVLPTQGSSYYKTKKRVKNDDPTDIDGYKGPWAEFSGESHTSKPSAEDAAIMAEYMAKRRKRSRPAKEDEVEAEHLEKAQLHIKDPYDYQGRSFLQAPRDLDGVNLYDDTPPDGCRIPRNCAHTYKGHTKAITATKYFPKTAHLVLSSSLDNKVKLWELYKGRRCIMTYSGHKHGVRDIAFDRDGEKLVSASYDKYIKLWSTETGQCIQRFTSGKMPYCVKFNPDPENSHLFLAGMSNKKILCWDCRSGEIVQEYDRHLGAINSLTFVDENRKFISSSDDKSMRVWEWDIPVDVKYIADPTLHSMPAVTSAPNNKRLLCQSMDNKIQAFTCHNKFKLDNKKVFKGHMVAGYACVPDFSCDMSLVVSGDADGKIFFWSWSTTKIITTVKAHDGVCISVMWHPHERQRLISAGWDNLIKIWE